MFKPPSSLDIFGKINVIQCPLCGSDRCTDHFIASVAYKSDVAVHLLTEREKPLHLLTERARLTLTNKSNSFFRRRISITRVSHSQLCLKVIKGVRCSDCGYQKTDRLTALQKKKNPGSNVFFKQVTGAHLPFKL